MKRSVFSLDDRAASLADAADGWLGDVLPEGPERSRAASAMVACLLASFLLMVLCVPALLLAFPLPLAISGGLAASALPLAAAGLLAATGSVVIAGHVALAGAAAALAALALANGGLASPFLMCAALMPLEAARLSKSRRGFAAGCAAASVAVLAAWAGTASGLAAAAEPAVGASALALLAAYAIARGFLGVALDAPQASAALVPMPAHGPLAPDLAADEADILDRLPGLLTLHGPRGEVMRVSGADREAFRAWMGDASGQGYLTRIHVGDRIRFLEAIDRLRRGAQQTAVELRMERVKRRGESQFAHVAVDLMAERDEAARFTGVLAQTRDISEMVSDREREAGLAEQAESANAAKTRFLAAVSHELRTPLNAIIGFSDVLGRDYFGALANERQREYVSLIHQSGEHLLSLVNTMLDMSKIEAGRYELFAEPFAIAGVVESCDAMLGLQASEKGVTLTRRVARGAGEVTADRRAIQQILINLIGNAIKFTDKGGVITMDADRVIVDGLGERLRLTVSDTGVGIPADKLARIGEPFMQADSSHARSYEGTGLGLSLVKGLVELHGGLFRIESRWGEGTVVTIDIPADGSGVRPPETAASGSAPVDFPPRLPKAEPANRLNRKPDHDATARTA